jgi:very-short-patch-repair endonuclease
MRTQSRTVEERIGGIASRQRGLITHEQMLAARISPSAIKRRVAKGLLIREHRGVYRVGHAAPNTEATYLAAVLAAGDGAALAGRAAAHLMRLLKGASPAPVVVTRTERHIDGVTTVRVRRLDRRDTWIYQGIRCTTIARTLVDLAETLNEDELARACHEAMVLYRTKPKAVEAALARKAKAPGAAMLRRILRGDTKLSLSKLESAFLSLLKENRLEVPETNKIVGGRYVDCRWPARKLTVELDSYRYHATRHAWEQDRKRERSARARGDDFRRYTWGDVFDDPGALVRELRPLLQRNLPLFAND